VSEEPAHEELVYEVVDGIGWMTFNRPQARNALNFSMYEQLTAICAEAGRDRSVRAMVLTGAGEKAFAAGTDISEFLGFRTAEDAFAYERRIDGALAALETVPIPTIAAISGACTGGGAAIAACCDLRIGAASSRFGFPVARTLGNCLSMNNYARLKDLIGSARSTELIFTARLIDASEALGLGLLSEVLDDHAALMARAGELAQHVAGMAPLTLRATKEALRRLQTRLDEGEGDDLIRLCYTSNDFREGMDAFLTKRKPKWTGT
jgi:enoyl-CoA hydratase/carnithine racemase